MNDLKTGGETFVSPYFEQHMNGPVKWKLWDTETLDEAKTQDRPIFLHIGYSACHFCELMNRTTFRDENVAALLNAEYIPVLVDREIRPDLDAVYMRCCQFMTGGGGWPLNLILTPEGEPLWAGGFLEIPDSGNRQGMISVLETGIFLWKNKREEARGMGKDIVLELRTQMNEKSGQQKDAIPSPTELLKTRFDARYGGFGFTMKFPNPVYLSCLTGLCIKKEKDPYAEEMLKRTLNHMREGEITDAVRGGIFRYAQTRDWGKPHYEKMLPDQALMAAVYADAALVLNDKSYAEAAGKILNYTAEHLQSPEGMFYSAQAADEEFYTKGGSGKFPFRDKTIRCGTNARMVTAFIRYRISAQDAGAIKRGEVLMKTLTETLIDEDGVLHAALYRNVRSGEAFLDDYADIAEALLELYRVTFNREYLTRACAIIERAQMRFLDDVNGGYYLCGTGQADAPVFSEKPSDDSDRFPANVVLYGIFHRLYALCGEEKWLGREKALRDYLEKEAANSPENMVYACHMLRECALPLPSLKVSYSDREELEVFYKWLSKRPLFQRRCAVIVEPARENEGTLYTFCGHDCCHEGVDSVTKLEAQIGEYL